MILLIKALLRLLILLIKSLLRLLILLIKALLRLLELLIKALLRLLELLIKSLLRLLELLIEALLRLLELIVHSHAHAHAHADHRSAHKAGVLTDKSNADHVAASESVNDLVSLLLILTVSVGVAAVGTVVGKLKLDLIEVGRANVDLNSELIRFLVARRIARNPLTVGGSAVNLRAVLLNVVSYVADLRNIDDIGVFLAEVALFADNELALIVVNMYLCASAKASCNVEAVKILSVLLAVLDLRLDFADGRFFLSVKKGESFFLQLAQTLPSSSLLNVSMPTLPPQISQNFFSKSPMVKSPFQIYLSALIIQYYTKNVQKFLN